MSDFITSPVMSRSLLVDFQQSSHLSPNLSSAFSVRKHLVTYASGGKVTYNELNHYLKEDPFQLRVGDCRMQDMIRYVVNSKLFLEK